MKFRTFAGFVGPSLILMTVFIAYPLISVLWQSFHLTQGVFETVTVETCTPGFTSQICTEETQRVPVLNDRGVPVTETTFVGLEVYRTLLRPDAISAAFSETGNGLRDLLNVDFYKALRFTLTFTLITLPLVIGLGLLIALTVNSTLRAIRGPVIFVTLLPFIITPVIGALAIRWLFVGDGILTAGLEALLERDIAMFAQAWTIEILILFYRVWHVAPFAFVVFYAGLQTVNQDTLESAIVDGASRFERLRFVVVPHLMPLIVFIALIHLMDAYRVFEEIIGFRAQAHVISLQWLTYNYLTPTDAGTRLISSASATSMMTMIGIIILLMPVLRRTWRDHKRGA